MRRKAPLPESREGGLVQNFVTGAFPNGHMRYRPTYGVDFEKKYSFSGKMFSSCRQRILWTRLLKNLNSVRSHCLPTKSLADSSQLLFHDHCRCKITFLFSLG